MTRFLCFLLFFILQTSSAKDNWNITFLVEREGLVYSPNSLDPYSGNVHERQQSGQLSMSGTYVDGLKTGEWGYFAENGQLTQKERYSDGILLEQLHFREGKKHGWASYYNSDGRLQEAGLFSDDLRDSTWNKWFDTGQLKETASYKFGLRNGKSKLRYSSGSTREVAHFINDTLHGSYEQYDESESLKVTGFFSSGEMDSIWTEYHPEGVVMNETTYRDGLLEGVYKEYTKNQILTTEGQYRNGKKDGKWSYWLYNGTPRGQNEFVAGMLIENYSEHYTNGQLKCEGKRVNPKPIRGILEDTPALSESDILVGSWSWWHEDGKKQFIREYTFVEELGYSVPTGAWKNWDQNGALLESLECSPSGDEHKIEYYSDGTKKSETFHMWYPHRIHSFTKIGHPKGTHTIWYENGNTQSIAKYDSTGEPTGKWQQFNLNGELLKEIVYSVPIGSTTEYFKSGKLKLKSHFVNDDGGGILVGSYEEWYETGQIRIRGYFLKRNSSWELNEWQKYSELGWEKGIKDGMWSYWNEDGSLASAIEYSNGALVGDALMTLDGDVIIWVDTVKATQNIVKLQSQYENGNLQFEKVELYDGKRVLIKEWYQNGQLKYKTSFSSRVPDGSYEEWYENGEVRVSGEYLKGDSTGTWSWWYSNGGKKYEGKYSNGKRDLFHRSWSKNGALLSEHFYLDGSLVE